MSSIYDSYPLDQKILGFFNGYDSRREMEEANREATERFMEDMFRQDIVKKQRVKAGVPALQRLLEVAPGHHGQAQHIRRFLLSLYNGFEWPMDMRRLRGLDTDLQQAVLAVIELDWCGREIHTYIKDGDDVFQKFWEMESPVIEDDD